MAETGWKKLKLSWQLAVGSWQLAVGRNFKKTVTNKTVFRF